MMMEGFDVALYILYDLGPLVIAAALSVLTPLLIIVIRHEIRLHRIRFIDEFSRNFRFSDHSGENTNPSFEFVKTKYAVDIDSFGVNIDRSKLHSLDLSDQEVDSYISNLRWYQIKSNRRILTSSILYMTICMFGFYSIFHIFGGGYYSVLYVDEMADSRSVVLENTKAVASIAFFGAYIFTLRLFLRAVSVFDLSAITMLRAAAHIFMSVSVALVLYRAIPDPLASVENLLNLPTSSVPRGLTNGWFIAAFVFGLIPDAGMQYLFRAGGVITSKVKSTDSQFQPVSSSIPLDVIDGIDFFTRFRLEEANILEVQNLATANPIMLHIETPYGIYETIDWVAQAQLCAIVGQERFFLFRQMNVRTIFDLERLVLSCRSTRGLRQMAGAILLTPTKTRADIVAISDTKFSFPGAPVSANLTPSQFDEKAIAATGADEEYDRFIRHYVRVMVDDLHVVRLRKIWQDIGEQLTPGAQYLSDDYDHPGGNPGNPP